LTATSIAMSTEVAKAPEMSARLVSLDVFRGAPIAAMILVNNPGNGASYWPLRHAKWNGWSPPDLIFPFFLFIVGVSLVLSYWPLRHAKWNGWSPPDLISTGAQMVLFVTGRGSVIGSA